MDVEVLGVLLPIIISLGAFVMIVYIRKFENIERMAIIDKGLDPKLFKSNGNSPSPVLRWALLLIGSGVGLVVGAMLDDLFRWETIGYFSMLMIFGGLGLVIAYVVEEKRSKNNP